MKSKLFYFILGAIIFSPITAIAINVLTASHVEYTDSNDNKINVKTALDSLYSEAEAEAKTDILNKLNLSNNSFTYSEDIGSSRITREATTTVDEGSYLVDAMYNETSYTHTSFADNQTWGHLHGTNGACKMLFARRFQSNTSSFASFTHIAYYTCHFDNNATLEVGITNNDPTASANVKNENSSAVYAIKLN